MSDQLHHKCEKDAGKPGRLFLLYGAMAIALSAVFGYGMASLHYTDAILKLSEIHAGAVDKLDSRHARQINAKDKEMRRLRNGEIK